MKKVRVPKTVDMSGYEAELSAIEREFDAIIELFVKNNYFDNKKQVIQTIGEYGNDNSWSLFEAGRYYFRWYFKKEWNRFQKTGKI